MCIVARSRLSSSPVAIREVAVFGIPDPQWGELVAAVQA